MDALIVLMFVIVLSIYRLRSSDNEAVENVGSSTGLPTEQPLEIGTNLMLNYESDAFELILKELFK